MKPDPSLANFLNNLNLQLQENLSNNSLNVDSLSKLVYMSRTNLHRKINRAVGMSTTEYIRYVRLMSASRMLIHHPDWSIQQVALAVGFSSQSYFSRRFKERFGVCPKKWRERQRILQ